jgi:hypothetical protein
LTRVNHEALSGHRRIASDLAASFAPSLPGGIPIARFQLERRNERDRNSERAEHTLDASAAPAEAEGAYRALARPSSDAFDESFRGVRFGDDLGEKRRVDGGATRRTITQDRHVVDAEKDGGA